MADPKEPTIRLCQSCGFRLPYTAAPDDTLCVPCEEYAADAARRDEANRRWAIQERIERERNDS